MQQKEPVSPHIDRTSHWRKGWRAGIRLCAIFTTCIFIFNMIISIYVLAKHGSGSAGNGTVVMYTGKCKTTKRFSLWLHFGINAVSTCLLGAGNYTMQVLNSPTREEINKHHACSRWVEIGVPSFRNLRWISKGRVVLWWLLALSSVPLHLLFNSVVFTSVGTNLYSGIVAPKSFLERSSYYITSCMYGCNYSQSDPIQNTDWKDRVEYIRTHASSFERLENAACVRKYGQSFISDYHDLIVVTSNNSLTVSGSSGGNPVVIPFEIYLNTNNARLYEWICGFVGKWCDTRQVAENAKSSGWEVNGQPIEYCLAEPWPEECTLSFNASIMFIT
ncbi:hypothetical protein BDD12DRAFT_759599 [Trichophaea hybrida]|nr:hypothetical protein BDD12DRAFT_759599 [Trichophaea hybrida]